MALTLFSNAGDAATALPPHDLPEPEFPRGLTSTTESAGVPMTEGEALAAPLPPQVPSITVGASAPEARPEIPDPELTRAGIPRATENPLAKLFGGIRWDFLKPTTWMELIQENRRKMEVRRELSTPEMKETFRIALDKGMPLMAGEMNSYEDVEKENTSRIVDKFLKAMTGGSMHYGVNGVQRKLLIQEAAHRFFDGRGAESEVALKGEIEAAAMAEKEISAVEYKERFSRISPLLTEYIGTGTRAQVLAGHDPGIIEKVKGDLNEKYELQTEVADALNEAGGDPARAIRMLRQKSAEEWNKSRSPYNPYNSFSGSANLSYSLSADRNDRTIGRLEEMQAEFDRAGIPEGERADHIRDTVVATAWTQDSKDNIRLGSDRTIYINPGQVFGQRDAIVAEINASPASADQKHEAIQRLDLMRANMAAKMDELLRRTDATGGDEWKKYISMVSPPARIVYGSPFSDSYIKFANDGKFASRMDAVDAYVKSQGDRGFLFKFDDAITVGIQTGTIGVGKTVVGAAAGLSGLGGMMGWDTAKEWSGVLGKTQMEMGDRIADLDKASDLRGNTGVVLKVAKDFSNTLTQIAPMLAGGQYAAGLNGLAGTVIRGMAVYGTPALQGAESVYGSALDQARRRKGGDLNSDEIIAVLGDSRVQAGAFLNAFQGAALARLLPRGTERAAVGGGLKGLTVRDFLSRGGGELLREPNFRKEMWQLTKNLFADASDEMIEEFLNTATDHIIRAGTLEEDLRFGDVLEDAAYSGFLGGGTGGLLPQLRHGERFYENVPGAITITGSPPDTPGNPFRNPDGTLPLKEQFHESGDPDLKAKEAPATDRQQHVRSFRADLISGKHDMEELGRRAQGDPELEGYLRNSASQLKMAEESAFEMASRTRRVSTDDARPFLPGYADADPLTREIDYHRAAGQLSGRVSARMLAETPEMGIVTVLAGGPGSGKTTASSQFTPHSDFIIDTTLSRPEFAEKLRRQIEESGREIVVVYVHRRFPLSVKGMVGRYLEAKANNEIARIIPVKDSAISHLNAQETILGLKGIRTIVVDNNGESGKSHKISLEDLAKDRYDDPHEKDTGRDGRDSGENWRGGDSFSERERSPGQAEDRQDHRRAGSEARLEDEGRRVIEDYRQRGRLTDAEADAFLGVGGDFPKTDVNPGSNSKNATEIDSGERSGEDSLSALSGPGQSHNQQQEESGVTPGNGAQQEIPGRSEEEIRGRIRKALARREEGKGGESIGDGSESDVFEFGPGQVLKEIKKEGVSRYGNDGRIHDEHGQEAVEEKAKVIQALGGMQTIVVEEGGKIFIVQERGTPITETEYLSIELPFGIEPTRQGTHKIEIDGDEYLISDLKPENFVKDSQGNIRLIDLITGKQGKGGGSR